KIKSMNIRLNIKKEILNHLSHEVRTPLQGVKSCIDLLIKHCNEYSNSEQLLRIVNRVNSSVKGYVIILIIY
ncbi:histidine kinase dimerization/phospho-acceptor domain-containing protein, partial [Orientia tsutsugamushi]